MYKFFLSKHTVEKTEVRPFSPIASPIDTRNTFIALRYQSKFLPAGSSPDYWSRYIGLVLDGPENLRIVHGLIVWTKAGLIARGP